VYDRSKARKRTGPPDDYVAAYRRSDNGLSEQEEEIVSDGKPRPWGRIIEIAVSEVPSGSPYFPLYEEIVLRLERTNGNHALAIPFDSPKTAKTAASALRTLAHQRRGIKFFIVIEAQDSDGAPTLYVRRGPNWTK
jgi:hypothetical protein